MDKVRRYLKDEEERVGDESGLEQDDEEEASKFLSCARAEERSSDAKSIGSLSQHLFESDNENEDRYLGTCNGYTSHPGSKSNLLLCSECDQKTRTCTYRPQTPSQYGRFVEERVERQDETRLAVSGTRSIVKSPLRFESGSPRYLRSRTATASPSRSPGPRYKSPVPGCQERRHDARSPAELRERSPRRDERSEKDSRWRPDEESEDYQEYQEESEDSPPCPLCNGSNGGNTSGNSEPSSSRCPHCILSSDQDEQDLICFRCQMSAEEETTSVEGSVCPKCESMKYGTNGSCQTTSSSSEGTKCHVDAVVKIQVNNRSIDVDSDDTIESDNNREAPENPPEDEPGHERLETIPEIKNDNASDFSEDNGSKINGQPRSKYLNYMIVLIL